MKRKIIIIVVFVLMTSVLVVGCGNGEKVLIMKKELNKGMVDK